MHGRLTLLLALGAFGCASPCDESGVVCSVVGDGRAGNNGDGLHADATRLYYPTDVAAEPGTGRVFINDWNNEILRAIDEDGRVRTFVGREEPGDGDDAGAERTEAGAPGASVSLNHPLRIAFAPDGTLAIAAWHNHKVRTWDPVEDRVRVLVGAVPPEAGTGANAGFSGDGGPSEDALAWFPSSVTHDDDGTLYFVDQKNERVRRVKDGRIDTVAGNGAWGLADGPCADAEFRFADDPTTPQPLPGGAVLSDGSGVLFTADSYNGVIRAVDLDADAVTTVATGLAAPADLAWGPDGRLFVAEAEGHVVSAIDLATGQREVVAGTGAAGPGIDRVAATASTLDHPYGIGFDEEGALWIADTYNSRVRRVAP